MNEMVEDAISGIDDDSDVDIDYMLTYQILFIHLEILNEFFYKTKGP